MTAKVTVIVGPPRSGKTSRLLERYRTALSQFPETSIRAECLWLAPTHGSVSELRDALIGPSQGAFLEPGISTFAGFAEQIVAASNRRVRPLSRLQKRTILRQIAAELLTKRELSFFGVVATTPGFLAQLDEWIAELKRQDMWAEDFARQAGGKREQELAALYRHYQRRLQRDDLYDAEGCFWAARDVLQDGSLRQPLEYALIVVDGFSDFTAAQFDILRLLAARSAEVLISLTVDPEPLGAAERDMGRAFMFHKVRGTYAKLRQLLPDLVTEVLPPDSAAPGVLRHLERNLFRDDADLTAILPAEASKSLEIVAASSIHQEIEEIARRIKASLHAGTVHPQDVLVVFPHLAEAAARVEEVFDDFGIPCWIETRPRLASSPLVRTLVSLLRLRLEDWPFRRLLEIIGNRTLTLFDQGSVELRAEVEQCVRAVQLPAGRERLFGQLRNWSADRAAGREDRARHAIEALGCLERLADALEGLPEESTLSDWTTHLSRLLAELGISQDEPFSSAWGALRRGLHSVEVVSDASASDPLPLGLGRLLELIELVAADLPLPGSTDAVGSVRVLTAESARQTPARHVYLAGLSEQAFSSAPRADQLDLSTDHVVDQGDAMYVFYALVTRAAEHLTLSYPALDNKGQLLPPSPLLVELQRCFGPAGLPETRQTLGETLSPDSEPMSRSAHRQFAVAKALAKDQSFLAGLLSQPSPEGAGILGALRAIASRGRRDQFGPFEGLIESEAARTALAHRFDARHLWSPSQLETFATCGFRFFADNLLQLEPLEDLALAGDAGRRGSLLHHVLATIHAQLLEQPADSPEDEAWQSELADRFGRALDARIEAKPLGGLEQALREIERRQIAAWAADYARQESDYRRRWNHLDEPPRPAFFEVRFGPEVRTEESSSTPGASTPQPFEIDLGEEKIRITGQIDRIDVGRVGGVTVLNVIDYKSGKQVQLKDEHMQTGRQLQLPLYALAAEELLLAGQGARALAAGYWSIRGQGFEKAALELRRVEDRVLSDNETPPQLRPQIVATLRKLVADVRAGQFPVFNEDPHCTRWCPHSTICRVAQIRSLEKVWPTTEGPES